MRATLDKTRDTAPGRGSVVGPMFRFIAIAAPVLSAIVAITLYN